jgi:hypothetical protein
VTRFSVTRELQVWDIAALRFGVGALLLALAVLRRGSRLPAVAWREDLVFAVFCIPRRFPGLGRAIRACAVADGSLGGTTIIPSDHAAPTGNPHANAANQIALA